MFTCMSASFTMAFMSGLNQEGAQNICVEIRLGVNDVRLFHKCTRTNKKATGVRPLCLALPFLALPHRDKMGKSFHQNLAQLQTEEKSCCCCPKVLGSKTICHTCVCEP